MNDGMQITLLSPLYLIP